MNPRPTPSNRFNAREALSRVEALAAHLRMADEPGLVASYLLSVLARRLDLRVVVLDRRAPDVASVRRHLVEALRGVEVLAADGWGWVQADIAIDEFCKDAEAVLQQADQARYQAELRQ